MPISRHELVINTSIGSYSFFLYNFEDTFAEIDAVYIYIKLSCICDIENAEPIYIGETDNLHNRMIQHLAPDEYHKCALAHGANALLIHYAPYPGMAMGLLAQTSKDYVMALEKALLHKFNTPCNTKNNTWAS